eukprot:CAMPEP_0113940334 /NCGR_PEP_ID=MMETSP1339-20121228/6490_1 /TAXON_ID=94617 /ORGANISM="Fibrocapsa japonica" /LENGTH=224 /DNA_ID=CAMNT_0000944133 /DNA_START=42 /DNA_END=713 /DNA_ORIENTATION=+ /assembly_acc=CAM_ASM_000762
MESQDQEAVENCWCHTCNARITANIDESSGELQCAQCGESFVEVLEDDGDISPPSATWNNQDNEASSEEQTTASTGSGASRGAGGDGPAGGQGQGQGQGGLHWGGIAWNSGPMPTGSATTGPSLGPQPSLDPLLAALMGVANAATAATATPAAGANNTATDPAGPDNNSNNNNNDHTGAAGGGGRNLQNPPGLEPLFTLLSGQGGSATRLPGGTVVLNMLGPLQ